MALLNHGFESDTSIADIKRNQFLGVLQRILNYTEGEPTCRGYLYLVDLPLRLLFNM
jgi:hypothetical protein